MQGCRSGDQYSCTRLARRSAAGAPAGRSWRRPGPADPAHRRGPVRGRVRRPWRFVPARWHRRGWRWRCPRYQPACTTPTRCVRQTARPAAPGWPGSVAAPAPAAVRRARPVRAVPAGSPPRRRHTGARLPGRQRRRRRPRRRRLRAHLADGVALSRVQFWIVVFRYVCLRRLIVRIGIAGPQRVGGWRQPRRLVAERVGRRGVQRAAAVVQQLRGEVGAAMTTPAPMRPANRSAFASFLGLDMEVGRFVFTAYPADVALGAGVQQAFLRATQVDA